MRVPRIYTEQALPASGEVELDEGASHHILKVLRMQAGRPLILFNGDGSEYFAEIESAGKKLATVQVTGSKVVNTESPLHSHIAIGLSRGERFDLVLQKATELGVSEITPLFTERTEVKLAKERLEKKISSWQKIITSACEQCGRNKVPTCHPPQSLDAFLAQELSGKKFVLHHRNSNKLLASEKVGSVTLLIGPEGGLSEQEIEQANSAGFLNLALGPRVLRTETAPLAALSLMQHCWGDF